MRALLVVVLAALFAGSSAFGFHTASKHPRQHRMSTLRAQQLKDSPMAKVIREQFKEGKRVTFGVLQQDVDPAQVPDAETRKQLIAEASSSLTNIDSAERDRRKNVGLAALGVAVAVYAALLAFKANFWMRLVGIYVPSAVAAGFIKSSQEGL